MIKNQTSFTIATLFSLPLVSAVTPAAWGQIDQVYDVSPPIYEERELESVEVEANAAIWPNRGFVYEQPPGFDDEAALPLESVTMLYEGQPLPPILQPEPGPFEAVEFGTAPLDLPTEPQ
ncbi:hypothetical protein C7271_08535 [filamentous cyanobacterium CCP5]|nr:hypothetical protein C7271_08535 [filamentous cyanobacterium CCP5]